MRVVNRHIRVLQQPIEIVSKLFTTLATSEDKIWPSDNWPAVNFKEGLHIGSRGGHGLIRYTVIDIKPGNYVKFKFTKPNGFVGTHELKLKSISNNASEIQHVIEMNTDFKAALLWSFVIRWLHNALIEEAFDNVENSLSLKQKTTTYNFWVRLLRKYYKRKRFNQF